MVYLGHAFACAVGANAVSASTVTSRGPVIIACEMHEQKKSEIDLAG